jgi:hypothetical protein
MSLDDVRRIVALDLAPMANAIDRQGLYPETVLRRLGEAGLFAAHVGLNPSVWDGISAMAVVGQTCLSTAFATWCQDSCGWYLANSDNIDLRDRLLPAVASGRQLGGTALSNPMKAYANIEKVRLSGERVAGGYAVTGTLPWVSNLGPDHIFGAIFTVPGRKNGVMAMVRCDQPDVKFAQRSHFCALEGTRTMSVMLKRAFIPDSQILADPAEPFLVRVMPGFILLQAGMALGVIRGAIDAMQEANTTHRQINAFLPEQPQLFEETLETLEQTVKELAATPFENNGDFMRRLLGARLDAAEWSLRAASAAVLHAGTRGFLIHGSAQRRLREACFVAIVTPSIKHLRKELADIAAGGGCMSLWKSTTSAHV